MVNFRSYFGNKRRGKTHPWVFTSLSLGFPVNDMRTQETQRGPTQSETGALFAACTISSSWEILEITFS